MEATLDTLLEHFQIARQSVSELWNKSKFFRIISIVTGSIGAAWSLRNIWIATYRKMHHLPNGPFGFPLIGNVPGVITDGEYLKGMARYGTVTSYMMGPYYGILINEPHLARKFYTAPTANNVWIFNPKVAEMNFASSNGKNWSDRRRIIYANLMSTMKASYVEKATKKFIKTKVFSVFDEAIKDNKATAIKPLFRPIGFNIVLQACFGKELQSLDDEFWLTWDDIQTENNAKAELQMLLFMTVGDGNFGDFMSKLLTGDTFLTAFNRLIDILDDFSKDSKNNVELDDDGESKNDENVKLFDDYVDDYVESQKGSKWTRRHLLGDMMIMFFAATDTTFSALAFALLLAAKYPKIQQELHDEIINAFGDDVDNIELRNKGILKIPKLRAFIQETLRIFPPVPATGFRQILDDGVTIDARDFDGKKYNVPIGTFPLINVAAINKNPKNWIKDYDEKIHGKVNMDEIHFDFWMDDDGKYSKQKNGQNFFTFHVGKRDCIGQALAMKELMIVLAMIFMKYKVEGVDGKTDFDIPCQFNGVVIEPAIDNVVLKART